MKLNLSFEIDLEEVLRMLGAQGTKEQAIRDLSRQAAECVQKAAVPRATYQRMPCERLRPLLPLKPLLRNPRQLQSQPKKKRKPRYRRSGFLGQAIFPIPPKIQRKPSR